VSLAPLAPRKSTPLTCKHYLHPSKILKDTSGELVELSKGPPRAKPTLSLPAALFGGLVEVPNRVDGAINRQLKA